MSVATAPMTTAEWMALPDDGIRRRLHHGELIEEGYPNPMCKAARATRRTRNNAICLSNIAGELNVWRSARVRPNGAIFIGEAAIRFSRAEETAIGVDVAYVQPELMVRQTDDNTVIVGVPTLIVEILSPSTTVKALDDRLKVFGKAAVPVVWVVVWVVDPQDKTVTVYRHGQKPTMVNDAQDLIGGPELPGFQVPVARLFE